MPRKKPNYYKCREAFVTQFEGETYSVAVGEIVRAGHPLLKRREGLFEPVENFGRFDVEQATAAPAEKRGKPKRSAKKK